MMNYTSEGIKTKASCWFARSVNQAGIALIKEYEGLNLRAYRCPGKVWTIGYGHTRTTQPTMVITKEEAEDLLRDDLEQAERAVARLVQVTLSDNQFAALVSFVFNVGEGNFERSTLLKLLNRGWYEQVPAQLMRWNKAGGEELGGLTRRRAAEGALWRRADEGGF
ncbi:MAG: lysozyme [Alphaproteobacteria bacterium]|jgi:GH24 family phage-related lysozyme (muramidase)|nr:lysozyme [Alphaproteobacteria bacterium]